MTSSEQLNATFQQHYPAVREKCRRMLRNPHEADDVAQETFVRLWKADVAGDDPRTVTAWIFRTCTRLAIDRLRAIGAEARFVQNLTEPQVDSAAAVDARIDIERVSGRLPIRELELLLLHRLDGLTHPEISEVTGRSPRTVRRLLHRCEQRIARLQREDAR